MLMAFDVIDTATVAEAVTAVSLVVYVAVNELLVKPRSRSNSDDESENDRHNRVRFHSDADKTGL